MHSYTSIPYKHIFDRCERNRRGGGDSPHPPGVRVQSQKPRGSRVNTMLALLLHFLINIFELHIQFDETYEIKKI